MKITEKKIKSMEEKFKFFILLGISLFCVLLAYKDPKFLFIACMGSWFFGFKCGFHVGEFAEQERRKKK